MFIHMCMWSSNIILKEEKKNTACKNKILLVILQEKIPHVTM